MEERQEQQVEVTFRLSAGLLGQLARLLAAVTAEGAGEAPAKGESAASETFDWERFRELAGEAAPDTPPGETPPPAERELPRRTPEVPQPAAEATAGREAGDIPLPRRDLPTAEGADLPAPEGRKIQVETTGAVARPAIPWPAGGREAAPSGTAWESAQALSRRFERDGRRYDGGFPLY